MSNIANRTALPLVLLACASLSPALARAAVPSARLEPSEVAPGEPATLIIEGDGMAEPPHIPNLPGLRVQPIGQQTQLTVTNGQRAETTSYLFRVSSEAQGDVVIDGITVDGAPAAPVTLHVNASASAYAGALGGGRSTHAASPGTESATREARGAGAFLKLRMAKREAYAGENIPFSVQAYFHAGTGVTVTGAPKFSDDALVVSGLDKEPKQVETMVGDERYLAVTWRGVLTAAKDGAIPAEVSLPATLQYMERSGPAQPGGSLRDLLAANSALSSMLADPFFEAMLDQPMFGGFEEPGRVVTRDVTLRASGKPLEVRALPLAGRPSDFQGAIGTFELHTALPSAELTQHEPVDLRIEITGRGNFGRFTVPGISSSKDFRAYAAAPARPASAGSSGSEKLAVAQPIAALAAGALTVPSAHFSYFDPALGKYVTKTAAPIAVQVAPAADGAEPTATADREAAQNAQAEGTVVRTLTGGGVPAWLFPTALASVLTALLAALALRLRTWPAFTQARTALGARHAVRSHRSAMRRAAAQHDSAGVVRAAAAAVRTKLARAWHMPAASITAHELTARLPAAPAPIVELLELADEADYAGRPARAPAHADLIAWTSALDRQIAALEVSS